MIGRKSFQGATLDEALSSACVGLDARLEEIQYDVLETANGDPVEIEAAIDPVAVLGLFMSETSRAGGLDIAFDPGALRFELDGWRLLEWEGFLEGRPAEEREVYEDRGSEEWLARSQWQRQHPSTR